MLAQLAVPYREPVISFAVTVPLKVEGPFTVSDPVIETDPVSICLSVRLLPNILEPLEYIIEELIVCTTRVCAVNVPVIKALLLVKVATTAPDPDK